MEKNSNNLKVKGKTCKDCKWWKEKDWIGHGALGSSIMSHCSNEKEYGSHPWIREKNGHCIYSDSFEIK